MNRRRLLALLGGTALVPLVPAFAEAPAMHIGVDLATKADMTAIYFIGDDGAFYMTGRIIDAMDSIGPYLDEWVFPDAIGEPIVFDQSTGAFK